MKVKIEINAGSMVFDVTGPELEFLTVLLSKAHETLDQSYNDIHYEVMQKPLSWQAKILSPHNVLTTSEFASKVTEYLRDEWKLAKEAFDGGSSIQADTYLDMLYYHDRVTWQEKQYILSGMEGDGNYFFFVEPETGNMLHLYVDHIERHKAVKE